MSNHEHVSSARPEESVEWFWGIVARCDRDRNKLANHLLMTCSRDELIRFHDLFKEAASELTDSSFTDQLEGQSEDDIQDIADWVVSQGQDYYLKVLKAPALIPSRIPSDGSSSFSSVVDNVFWDKYHESIPMSQSEHPH